MTINEQIQLIDRLDQHIRTGEFKMVRQIIHHLNKKQIANTLRAAFAHLARRAAMPRQVLLILGDLFNEDKKWIAKPSAEETALYAYALAQMGALSEATDWLSKVQEKNSWRTFFTAQIAMMEWDYHKSYFYIDQYLKNFDLPEYQYKVGQINLLASAIASHKFSIAGPLIEQIDQTINLKTENLIYGNLRELETQFYIAQEDYTLANKAIERSRKHLANTGSAAELWMKKWAIIVEAHSNPDLAFAQMQKLRNTAAQVGRWEVVRDLDFYKYKLTRDPQLFDSLYYGTPFTAYRQKLLREWDGRFIKRKIIHRNNGPDIRNNIDLTRCYDSFWHNDKNSYRFLLALNMDFYKPISEGQMFEFLYPKQRFDALSSRKRLRFHFYKLQHILKNNMSGIHVELKRDGYRLICNKDVSIKLPQSLTNFKVKTVFENLGTIDKNKWLNSRDIQNHLDCSLSTCTKIIKEAINSGQLEVRRQGKRTCYRLKP